MLRGRSPPFGVVETPAAFTLWCWLSDQTTHLKFAPIGIHWTATVEYGGGLSPLRSGWSSFLLFGRNPLVLCLWIAPWVPRRGRSRSVRGWVPSWKLFHPTGKVGWKNPPARISSLPSRFTRFQTGNNSSRSRWDRITTPRKSLPTGKYSIRTRRDRIISARKRLLAVNNSVRVQSDRIMSGRESCQSPRNSVPARPDRISTGRNTCHRCR